MAIFTRAGIYASGTYAGRRLPCLPDSSSEPVAGDGITSCGLFSRAIGSYGCFTASRSLCSVISLTDGAALGLFAVAGHADEVAESFSGSARFTITFMGFCQTGEAVSRAST